jgi:predicted RNA-binding Zn-ribbon protein involved in translation (DUF1610 family)
MERPYTREVARLHRARSCLLAAGVLLIVAVATLVVATELGSWLALIVGGLAIGAIRMLLLYAVFSPCPMCGNFFYTNSWSVLDPSVVARVLGRERVCSHCGFQLTEENI